MHDSPFRPLSPGAKKVRDYFETAAFAVAGKQKDTYYGSVQWGWERDGEKQELIEFKAVSLGAPSASFLAAAELWNKSLVWDEKGKKSGVGTIKLPVAKIYRTPKETMLDDGKVNYQLPEKTRLRLIGKHPGGGWDVEIVDGLKIYVGLKGVMNDAAVKSLLADE